MNRKKGLLFIGVGLFALVVAGVMDATSSQVSKENQVDRNEMGEGEKEIQLILDAEDVLRDYPYSMVVEEQIPTEQEAEELFLQAQEEIQATFYGNGEDASHVTDKVFAKDSYVDGKVEAQWYFSDYEIISPDGTIQDEMLTEQGTVLNARVELDCGEYRQIYSFPFQVYPREMTNQEQLLFSIKKEIDKRMLSPGEQQLELPQDINGILLKWRSKKPHTVWKVLLMELFLLILYPLLRVEKAKKRQKERQKQLLLDYPDMVSKLTVLIGSGMSIKQAWNRISARYTEDRQRVGGAEAQDERLVYKEMKKTSREMEAGESERIAYKKFGERIGLQTYHRFVRILISNQQKGTGGLCDLLQKETEDAFEQRKLLAKKLGEEASTKMLFPLILMMGIVMAITIAPALIGFMM